MLNEDLLALYAVCRGEVDAREEEVTSWENWAISEVAAHKRLGNGKIID